MNIFVAFVWIIEAANYLGLIETEAQDPKSRAYRLAHDCLGLLKTELVGRPLELLSGGGVRKRSRCGASVIVEGCDAKLVRRHDNGRTEPLLDLGPGGSVHFQRYGKRGLEVTIKARTDDGGAHDVNLILPAHPTGQRA